MSIFFLVVALLVAVIVLSQLTWSSRRGERRSVEHHEQAMAVLRSLSSRRLGSETGAEIESDEPPWSTLAASSAPAATPASASPPADGGATKPSFVFFADDSGIAPLALQPKLASPPKIDDVAGASPSRSAALLLALSRSMARPRVGLAAGLVMIVVMATVAGTLVGIMSFSSNRSQRVRQVTSPPITSPPAPAPPPTVPAPVSSDAPPSTTVVPVRTWATTISPTRSTPRQIRSSTTSTSPPPTSTSTSPPPTSNRPPSPASVASPTPSTSSPPKSTTTTTSTTSPTSTTSTTKP